MRCIYIICEEGYIFEYTGKDPLVCDMLQIIYPHLSLKSIVHEIEGSMTGGLKIPKLVIDFASFVCPF